MAATAPFCILLTPLLPLAHQALLLAMAISLKAVASSRLVKQLLMQVGWDPIYASVFNRTLGNIEARGLAVAGPLGNALHQLAPGVFASPDQVAPGAWATALVGEGVSVLAWAIATMSTETLFIVGGLALWMAGRRRGLASARASCLALALLGLMLQARGVMGLLRLRFSLQDMEVMGLSHLFTKLFPVDAGSYEVLMAGPLRTIAPYLVPFVLISGIYGAFLVAVLIRARLRGRGAARTLGLLVRGLQWPGHLAPRQWGYAALATTVLLGGSVLSQEFFPALANYNYRLDAGGAALRPGEETPSVSVPPAKAPLSREAPKDAPSQVTISGGNFAYSYVVNGRPEKVRGVGYNAMRSQLTREERAARYDRDFAQMKAAGIKTILGWGRDPFDELTLAKAQAHGLGVVMPYSLPGDGDYGSAAYEQEVESKVKAWVTRFRMHPALRMWGIGNETIHSMGRNPETPRSRAFAQFYVRLADAVRAIDPDHPVIYRDAEDLYLGPVRDAFKKDGVPRPWFIYGVNFFTFRICEALSTWGKRGWDVPVMVSEFAPSGLSRRDRPEGYLRMWRCIASQRPSVLGGFAYAWTTDGPEAIDRVMGLVDGEGKPVDDSLWTLGQAFEQYDNGDLDIFFDPKGRADGRSR